MLKGYKIFNIDSKQSRPKDFWKNVLVYKDHMMNKFASSIKTRNKFVCPLCGSQKGDNFLSYNKYQLIDCSKCGLVSPNVDFTKLGNHGVYDDEVYKRDVRINVLNTYDYRKKTLAPERLNYILEKTKISKNRIKLLDVGCGPGYLLSYLKDNGVKYKGLELSDFLVKICKNRGLNVESADLKNEKDGSYNIITLYDVLEHLTDPITLFKTINKKLIKNGFVIAHTPNIHSLSFLLMGKDQNNLYPFQHICFFDQRSLDYLAKKTGFKVHSVDYYGLDVMDYFCMKNYEDRFDYSSRLKDFIPLMQAIIDKQNISNHMRIVFQKSND